MSEIVILEGREAKVIRLQRAKGLAKLFDNNNDSLLEALKSLLVKIEYESLEEENREQANGKRRLASALINRLNTEVNDSINEMKQEKTADKK